MLELPIDLSEGLLHMLHVLAGQLHQIVTMPHECSYGPYAGGRPATPMGVRA